jgi:hypothetical protein
MNYATTGASAIREQTNVTPVLALSIRQPWVELILSGAKTVENRSWRTAYRGRILLHSPAGVHDRAMRALGFDDDALPRGGIVGEVEVVDCVDDHPSVWFRGPFALVLSNPRRLPFMAMSGRQRLFRVEVPFLGTVT